MGASPSRLIALRTRSIKIPSSPVETMIDSTQSKGGIEFADDIFCPGCSYCLRGATGERCPECGYSLDRMRSGASKIPWLQRKQSGRLRTYWRTVWMVTFINRRFCEDYARPISYRDARLFQWLTVLHAVLPILLVVVVAYLTIPLEPGSEAGNPLQQIVATGALPRGPSWFERVFSEAWPVALSQVCLILFLATASGVPSYFFHPRQVGVRLQNNAIAMSYYTCGPLSLTALPVVLLAAAWAHGSFICWHGAALILAAALSAVVLWLTWWLNLVHTFRRIMPHLVSRSVAMAVGVPLLWLVLAGLIFIALPAIVVYVLVIIDSLRL